MATTRAEVVLAWSLGASDASDTVQRSAPLRSHGEVAVGRLNAAHRADKCRYFERSAPQEFQVWFLLKDSNLDVT